MAEAVSHAKFVETTGKIMEKLDTLNSKILAIRNEMSEIRDSVADSSARLTTIENEIIPQIKIDNKKLEKELKDSILQLEIHDRKMNLLIYGVQSKKDENVVREVRNIFENLGFSHEEARNMYISNAHRLPRRAIEGEQDERRSPDAKFFFPTTFLSMTQNVNLLTE